MKNWSVHTHNKITTGLYVLGVVILCFGMELTRSGSLHPLFWVGVVELIGAIVYRFTFLRCPHCGGKLLGCKTLPKHCPDCGGKL